MRASMPPTSTSPSCGCVNARHGRTDAARVLVAVPDGDLEHVVARQLRVVVDEALLAFEPDLLEEVPQLDDVGDGAALVIGVVGEIAVQRRVGLVE